MSFKTRAENNHLVIAVKGNMDSHFVTDQREQIESLPHENSGDIIFDLSSTEFIDSSGIGFLVFMLKRLKPKNRNIHILGLNGQPKKVVEMLRINRMIRCLNSLNDLQEHGAKDTDMKVKKLASQSRVF